MILVEPPIASPLPSATLRPEGEPTDSDLLFGLSRDLLCVASLAGYLQRLNPAWETVLGWREAELLNQCWLNWVHPDDRVSAQKVVERLQLRENIRNMEIRLLASNGSYKLTCWDFHLEPSRGIFLGVGRDCTLLCEIDVALKISENRFQDTFKLAPTGMAILSLDGRFLQVNQKLCQLLEYTEAELLGYSFQELTHPEDLPNCLECVARQLEGDRRPFIAEKRYRTKSGKSARTQVHCNVVRDNAGNPQYFISQVLDISGQKEAEGKLLSYQRLLTEAEAVSSSGAWSWELETDTWIFSEGWCRIHGVNTDILTSQQLLQLAHPYDIDEIRKAFRATAQHGQPYQITHRIVRHDNQEVRWVCVHGARQIGPDGTKRVYGAAVDVTEKMAAELALRESRERFSSAFHFAPMGMALVDITRRWLQVNSALCQMLGYSEEELLLKSFQEITHPDDLATSKEGVVMMLNGVIPARTFEKRYIHKNGDSIWVLVSCSLVSDSQGNPKYFISHIIDITQRIQALDALKSAKAESEAANRAKGDFLAIMSHEIRTPMNGILGFTGLLQETQLTEDQRAFVRHIQHSGGALLSLLNELLDFAKIEAGKIELETTHFDLSEIVTEVVSFLTPMASEKRIVMGVTYSDDVPKRIQGDSGRIRQVLLNLASNAVKFTYSGTIHVRVTREAPGHCRISVTDTGIGIPPENRQTLFQSFSQVDTSPTRRFGGSGLGLAISKRLVELWEGEIGVESQPNLGSTFWFTIPLGPEQMEIGGIGSSKKPNDKDKISSVSKEGLGLRGVRVLVVEDNATNQLFTAYMLRKLDCIVDVASDGAEAVTMISKVPYQIVLMDCCMPEMDGFKATEIIRAQPGQGRTVPIIAVTASVTPGERERCLRVGMNDFLAKPFSPSMLIKTMARWTLPYR